MVEKEETGIKGIVRRYPICLTLIIIIIGLLWWGFFGRNIVIQESQRTNESSSKPCYDCTYTQELKAHAEIINQCITEGVWFDRDQSNDQKAICWDSCMAWGAPRLSPFRNHAGFIPLEDCNQINDTTIDCYPESDIYGLPHYSKMTIQFDKNTYPYEIYDQKCTKFKTPMVVWAE
jgi:hypothetical protein